MEFDYKTIQLTNQDAVWTLTISRPEALNALNSAVLGELAEALRFISELPFETARALIITGAGEKSFVAGADIKEIAALNEEQSLAFAQRGQSIFHELNLLKIPAIAMVNGFALGGGCELALACDFIVAGANAKFGLPEVSLGLIPGFGGTVRLSRAVGMRKARELIYTGDMISADDALKFGLVNKVAAPGELKQAVGSIIEKIMQRSPVAVAASKRSLNRAWDLEVEEAQKFEAECFAELFTTEDVREGTAAFVEKRKPAFKGR